MRDAFVALTKCIAPEAKAAVGTAFAAASVRAAFLAFAVRDTGCTFALELVVAAFALGALATASAAAIVTAELTRAVRDTFSAFEREVTAWVSAFFTAGVIVVICVPAAG